MDSPSDSCQDCLCLFCRKIGHIMEECPKYREWERATTLDIELDSDVDMDLDVDSDADVEFTSPSPPFSPLPSTEESTQAMCQRCSQLEELSRIADHRPILWEDLEDDIFEDDRQVRRVHKKTTQIRPLGLVRSLRLLSTCPLCRLIFNMSYLRGEEMAVVPSAGGELVLVTGWTIHRLEPDLQWKEWRKRKGPYAKCVYTSVTTIPKPIVHQPQLLVDEVKEAVGILDIAKDQTVGLGVREVDPKTTDYRVLKDWLHRCDDLHHVTCRPLISEDLKQIKLVHVETRQIVSYPISGCDYIALSYVWGGVEQSSYKLGDILQTVPATFEDAMAVTRNLSKQYLWVDSLCIDQENDVEKATQIALMSTVYSGAWATIINLSGQSVTSGIPRVGTLQGVVPQLSCELWGKRFLSVMPTLHQQILSSLWGSRAWTYQEGLLSPRCLFFTYDQVYFECNSVQCCESLDDSSSLFHLQSDEERLAALDEVVQDGDTSDKWPEGIIGRGVLRDPFRPISNAGEAQVDDDCFAKYLRLVHLYTMKKMTHDSDSLNAFDAVLARLQENHYKRGFVHGLPIEDLPRALSWFHDSRRRRRVDFPAWSWAGWEGDVSETAGYGTKNDDETLMPPLRIWKAGRNDIPELIYDFNPTPHIIKELAARAEEENDLQDGKENLDPSEDDSDSDSDSDSLDSEYDCGVEVEETNNMSESSTEEINFENDPVFLLSKTMPAETPAAALPKINRDELLIEGIVIRLGPLDDPDGYSDGELDDEYRTLCLVGLEREPEPQRLRLYGPDSRRLAQEGNLKRSQQQEFVLLSREHAESAQRVNHALLLIDREGDVATRVTVADLELERVELLDRCMPKRMLFKLEG